MDLIFEKKGNIALITLNRPEALNALTEDARQGLLHSIEDTRNDDQIRCLILTGAGKGFCSGTDETRRVLAGQKLTSASWLREYCKRSWNIPYGIVPLLRRMEKPVIAAVNGVAAAAGLSLALACDFRIASEDARFISAFVKRGVVPGSGQSYYLPRMVGMPKALEIMLSGDAINAEKALEMGLVTKVVPRDELMREAAALANRLTAMPPVAMGLAKQLVYKAIESDLLSQIDYEMQMTAICHDTNDNLEPS